MRWDGIYELLHPDVKLKPLHKNTARNNLANLISTPKMSGTAQDCKGSIILTSHALIFLPAPALSISMERERMGNTPTMQIPLRSIDSMKTEEHSSYGGYSDVGIRCKDGSRFDFRCPNYPAKPEGYVRTLQDQAEAMKEEGVKKMEEEIKWLVAEAQFAHDRQKPFPDTIQGAKQEAGSAPPVPAPSFPDFDSLGTPALDLHEELFARQGACDPGGRHPQWRMTKANSAYELCDTYPSVLCVPAAANDELLREARKFRSKKRLPALTWCHPTNGATLSRCAQPREGAVATAFAVGAKIGRGMSGQGRQDATKDSNSDPSDAKEGGDPSHADTTFLGLIRETAEVKTAGVAIPSIDAIAKRGGTTVDTNTVTDSPALYIIDARSSLNAYGNALKGKGFENVEKVSPRVCPPQHALCDEVCTHARFMQLGGKDKARIKFMNIDNIHVMRGSIQSLSKATHVKDGENYFAKLQESGWMGHVSKVRKVVAQANLPPHSPSTLMQVIRAATFMANKLEAGHPMLVHCSDGWDRTSQLSALSQLLLDPYYRTFEGFKVLVEKDWGAFGYMFSKRGGKGSEQSPVFLQWLDCVWQLWRQNETQFQFNESFLVALARLTYSDW
jgi:hypothetical protein